MPRPPIDLARKIKDILLHTEPLPDEARSPILHYRRTGTDIWNALGYMDKALGGPGLYRAVGDRHLWQLYGMALVNLVEAFERFLKEMAAECVECLAYVVPDDRLDVFQIKGGSLAYHFRAGSLGTSLCESSTRLLTPRRQDLTYLKRFLDETARECNKRVGERAAELLTLIHNESPGLLVPAGLANQISTAFQIVLQVAGAVGVIA
jgi:hypothetical protein